MLELFQFEGCPFCEHVREALDGLGLDYIIRTVPRDPARRQEVFEISGQDLVPVLRDPERSVVVADSAEIIAYLRSHYGSSASS